MTDYTGTGAPAGPFGAMARLARPTHAILRIGAGLLFMQHGAQKLFGALGGVDGKGMKVELMGQMGLAGVLELFGGLLIVIGLATRPVAAILFLLMIAAYFMAHMPQGGLPVQNGGELALLYALIWLYFAGNGAGPASVDAAMGGRRGPGRSS
ncbi:MAG TPA: DoxX family protein [Longimicrobium sp.]|nr:DoxX family protein [Longimicrobium sp.]